MNIPRAEFAIIGGSGTNAINFPEDLLEFYPEIKILKTNLLFETPFGKSPPFKLFSLKGQQVLTVKMHGWRHGTSRRAASQQVFWVLKQSGTKKILSEGGVGAINHLLKPRDLLTPTDYLDFSTRKDTSLDGPYLLIMRNPVCQEIQKNLLQAMEKNKPRGSRVFDRGVYAVTDGRHFESRAEVSMLKQLGADIVGQSMCPEVYLAREIGACYGRVDIVVNYAEGIIKDWEHGELKGIYYTEASTQGRILLDAMVNTELTAKCNCQSLRKDTLLREET